MCDKVEAALEGLTLTLAEAKDAERLLGIRMSRGFLLSTEESDFRQHTGKLASHLGIEYNTRSRRFEGAVVGKLLRAAKTVLAAREE